MINNNSLQLRQMFLSAFEEVCNRTLSFDQATKNALADLQGKELNVQTFVDVKGFDFEISLNISFCDNGLILSVPVDDSIMDTDASIRAPSFTLFYKLLASQNLINDSSVLILGDVALASQFQSILSRLEVDWEEPLSRVTGDIVAHEIKRLVDSAKLRVKKSTDVFEDFIERNPMVADRRKLNNKRSGGRRGEDLSPAQTVSREILNAFSEQVTDMQKEQELIELRIRNLLAKSGNL